MKRQVNRVGETPEERQRALGVSSLGHTFEAFRAILGTAGVYKAMRALAEDKTKTPLLLCYGGVGNGKTHLLEAMVITFRSRGIPAYYRSWMEVSHHLLASMRDRDMLPYDKILANYCRSELPILLDDVGLGETQSGWEYAPLEEIVNYRYRMRLITVLVSNKDISELPDRIVSRFSDPDVGVVVLNSGKDYRRRKV